MRETAKQTEIIMGHMLLIIKEYSVSTRYTVKILYIGSFNLVSSLLRRYVNHLIIMLL